MSGGRVFLILALLAESGCAHRTRIESAPSGASVFINDRFACTTPCMYQVGATQLAESPVRLERRGFETVHDHLRTCTMTSRIVGGLFTLGLVPLFKWPHTYASVHTFYLRPLSREERLLEIDREHAAGKITAAERDKLRLKILAEP
jgi:PEGA domain